MADKARRWTENGLPDEIVVWLRNEAEGMGAEFPFTVCWVDDDDRLTYQTIFEE